MLQKTLWWEEYPFGQPETQQGTITPINTNFQLMRIPYPAPNASKTILLGLQFSNPNGTAAIIKIWDQDLTDSSTVAGNRGSSSAPLYTVTVPANGDNVQDVITRPYFQTGIACQTSQNNVTYSIYVTHVGFGV